MSLGLGKTQRYVLEHLRLLREQGDIRHQTAYALAASITGETVPSPSAVQSVRQVIRRLEERGLVETAQIHGTAEGRPDTVRPFDRYGRRRRYPHQYPPPDRHMLGARLPLTEEQAAQQAEAVVRFDALFGRPKRAG